MQHTEPNQPFWRQGDIFFVKLDQEVSLDQGAVLKNGIIARGEETGHTHRVAASSLAAGAALVTLDRSTYLRSPGEGADIVHEEHGRIHLPAGLFAVVRQQEFDGLRWRQVWD